MGFSASGPKGYSCSLFPILSISFKVGLLVDTRNISRSHRQHRLVSCASNPPDYSAASAQVDMFRGRDGVWSSRQQTVVVLWDLDNKPPRTRPPSPSAEPPNSSAAFSRFLPTPTTTPLTTSPSGSSTATLTSSSVKAWSSPPNPYTCGVCGRKCRTNLDLKKHFRQLHQRER
ncbi:hypothetical protein ZIOFF_007396 [Zingiber officinale]|uniref:C2H2-type domain-containing protein n=1 Tax=Zingiber officinale TaxID=94328 RepID=A0A8J5IEI0_ZINOF|nr:hypothetical protein ZIOFF_007396 [Zingiber officinale]